MVPYAVKGDSFLAGRPRVWSSRTLSNYADQVFDIAPDGKSAIAIIDADPGRPETHLRVVLNFGDEVRRRLAVR